MTWDEEDVRLDRAASAKSFHAFVRRAWAEVDQEPYVDGDHLRLSCHELEQWAREEGSRLVWNVPPQTGKSLLACVLLPSWIWTWWPEARFVSTSYEKDFAKRDGGKTLALCSGDWYRARWPKAACKRDDATGNFTNVSGGFRFATSMEAGALGRHGHFLVADDPLKPVDAFGRRAVNHVEVDECLDRWRSSFARAVLPGGRKLVVMQRLHSNDLAGYCVREGYRHARFPMRAEPGKCPVSVPHRCIEGDREDGELLWPERFDEEAVQELEHEMGPFVAAAQLQQRPSPLVGGFFRRDLFRYWDGMPGPKSGGTWAQSWDLTFGSKTSSASWVSGQLWHRIGSRSQLIDRVRARWTFLETVNVMLEKSRDALWGRAIAKVVEKKANGAAVMEVLESEVPGLVPWPEVGRAKPSKESCWNSVQPFYQAANVEHPPPDRYPWVRDYEERLVGCGGGDNDDADATAQMLLYLHDGSGYLRGLAVLQSGAR